MIDEARYLKDKIKNAKNIKRVFNNLIKKDYKVETIKEEDYFKTIILKGNIQVIIFWRDKTIYFPGDFEQEILRIEY